MGSKRLHSSESFFAYLLCIKLTLKYIKVFMRFATLRWEHEKDCEPCIRVKFLTNVHTRKAKEVMFPNAIPRTSA